MLRGFATINYWADDMAAATRWYADLLGVEPYFERSGPDGKLAYAEFRIGDYQHELGLISRAWAPPGAAAEPGGAVMHWHVDDIEATFGRLLSMGATEYQPITPRGDLGFVTASVVDPFGNVLGIEAARADGRWAAAYESQRTAEVPEDLAAALAQDEPAREFFASLGRSDRYAVILPLLKARTPEGRATLLQSLVAQLRAGQKPT